MRRTPDIVVKTSRNSEISPKPNVYVGLNVFMCVLTPWIWRKKLLNITAALDLSDVGLPVLKKELRKEFLRDITLNYSTNAEKKFLSQIDFNDKNDLRIAASFYSKKLRAILSYYTNKRTQLSFSTIKNRLKGTHLNLEQATLDVILNFLENRSTGNIDYNIDSIKKDLSISVTEYPDFTLIDEVVRRVCQA